MKKLQKVLILVLLAAPIFFIGCQKTDLIEEPVQTPADDFIDNTSVNNKEYCGSTLTVPLHEWGITDGFGSVTIGNDESNLIFNYDIDESSGYLIYRTAIFIINDGLIPPLGPSSGGYVASEWNPDNTARLYTQNFPFITEDIHAKVHQEVITFIELENEGIDLDQCLDIVAAANIYDPNTGVWKWIFANPTLKSLGWYVDFCIEPCEEPTCETAYAYGGDQDDCFLNLNTQGNNWGWSNGGITEDTYSWNIYAGAGQCDLSKGTLVGTLDIVYGGGIAAITYNIDAGYTLEETHLHVGYTEATRLPLNKKNKFITAPGQFEFSGGSYFEIPATGEIWVTAHAVVCGDFE